MVNQYQRTRLFRCYGYLFIVICFFVVKIVTQEAPNTNESNDSNSKPSYKIAIIGGGVGGTSTAYFLQELLAKYEEMIDYEIDIFEQSNKIGGRVATIQFDEFDYEAGGSILHERNHYAATFRDLFGLNVRNDSDQDVKTCIFNGRENVFCDDSWHYLTYLSLWYRYGFDPLRMEGRVTKVLEQFERIYELQEKGQAFETVADLLAAMNPSFLNLTRTEYKTLLGDDFGFSQRFINEIAQAVTLVNYGQTVSVHSFVGLVSFAGSGSQLWSVEGGNKLIPINLARHSNADIHLNTKVSSITYLGSHRFRVNRINLDQHSDELKTESSEYDYVIIATPLTNGNDIQFHNFTRRNDLLKDIFDRYQMHQTIATFVKGSTLHSYTDKAILSCNVDKNDGSFFTSFSPIQPVNNEDRQQQQREQKQNEQQQTNVYKLFSNSQLKTHDLYSFFDTIDEVREMIWHAYPEYQRINQPFPPFKIRSGAYYLNAIEWAASAIEMSLIGGKNMALLTYNDMGLHVASSDDEKHEMNGSGAPSNNGESTLNINKRDKFQKHNSRSNKKFKVDEL